MWNIGALRKLKKGEKMIIEKPLVFTSLFSILIEGGAEIFVMPQMSEKTRMKVTFSNLGAGKH